MSHIDDMLWHLRGLRAQGWDPAQAMARTDSAEFAHAVLDEIKERGTSELLTLATPSSDHS